MKRKVFIRKNRPSDVDKFLYSADEEPVVWEWSRLGLYQSRFTMLKRQLNRKYSKKNLRRKLNA